jgi:hypothetical protein
MPEITRIFRLVIALAAMALLASCTFTRFAYNQADTAVLWAADSYFELDGPQKDELSKRFERYHAWHRTQQLPEYAQFMRTAKTRLQHGVSQEDVLWFMDGLRMRVRVMGKQAAPDAAALLATLTPQQIENLKKHWEKDNKKYMKERKLNGTQEERVESEAKRTIKNINDWLIPLTAEQEAKVLELARGLPADMYQLHYADRLRRQKEFLALLERRKEDPAKFSQAVADWFVNWEKGRSPEYQQRLDAWWKKRADILVTVYKTFSQQQRTAALQRVQAYTDDFLALAGRGSGPQTANNP